MLPIGYMRKTGYKRYIQRNFKYVKMKGKNWKEVWSNVVAQGRKLWVFLPIAF